MDVFIPPDPIFPPDPCRRLAQISVLPGGRVTVLYDQSLLNGDTLQVIPTSIPGNPVVPPEYTTRHDIGTPNRSRITSPRY